MIASVSLSGPDACSSVSSRPKQPQSPDRSSGGQIADRCAQQKARAGVARRGLARPRPSLVGRVEGRRTSTWKKKNPSPRRRDHSLSGAGRAWLRAAALVAAHLQKAGEQNGIGHVRQATASPTPDTCCLSDFFNGTCHRGFSDTVPLRNQLQGRPLCPQPLLRRTHPITEEPYGERTQKARRAVP